MLTSNSPSREDIDANAVVMCEGNNLSFWLKKIEVCVYECIFELSESWLLKSYILYKNIFIMKKLISNYLYSDRK